MGPRPDAATVPGVEVIDLPDFGPDDYAAVVDGETDPFQTDHLAIEWERKTGHVGVRQDGTLIGCAGWVPTQVEVAGRTIDGVGLGGVIVHRRYRGTGVGGPLVVGAMARMGAVGRPLGLLFCLPQRVRFYESLDWQVVDHPVTVDQRAGPPVSMPLVTCWTALAPAASAPDADLRIRGLPF